MATPQTLTKSGKFVNATRRSGVPTSPLGRFDPTTGKTWQKPRLALNLLTGSRVKTTNPKAASGAPTAAMTRSIGMGGAGQRGRVRDVGSTKARGEA